MYKTDEEFAEELKRNMRQLGTSQEIIDALFGKPAEDGKPAVKGAVTIGHIVVMD
jgi:hypothetical protein